MTFRRCEICEANDGFLHDVFGEDNEEEIRFVHICCQCLEHEACGRDKE